MFAECGERGVPGARPLDLSAASKIWPNYFAQVEFALEDRKLKLVALLADFFCTPQADPFLSQVQDDCGTFYLPIDMQHFQKACGVDEFYAVLEEAPKEALSCMGAAVHMVQDDCGTFYLPIDMQHFQKACGVDEFYAVLEEAPKEALSCMGAAVHMVSTTRPLVLQMEFACGKCGTVIARVFPDGKFSPPVACSIHGCRSRTFIPNRSTAKLIDFQKIRVQELLKSENLEEGRVPRTVECELAEDLVDSCIPGDVITVTGIIKVINNYMDIGGGRSKNKNQGLYYLYLEAVSVRNSKSQSTEDVRVTNSESGAYMLFDFFSFSPRDLEFFVKFSEEHGSDIFRQIVHSFCPSIYGHELVKAGIVLALFGGVQKHSVDQNKVPVRGDIHVIIVGDPGLGKSQLLQAAAEQQQFPLEASMFPSFNAGLVASFTLDARKNDKWVEHEKVVVVDCFIIIKDGIFKLQYRHESFQFSFHFRSISLSNAQLMAHLSLQGSWKAYACHALTYYKGHLNTRNLIYPIRNKKADKSSLKALIFYFSYVLCHPFLCLLWMLHEFLISKSWLSVLLPCSNLLVAEIWFCRRYCFVIRNSLNYHYATSCGWQDVVEIMKESLYDKYVDERGFVDFARSGGMSQQKEAKRFLSALHKQSELQQKDCFSISEIYSLADKISLRVPDIDTFVENLNSVGYLLKKGPKMYQKQFTNRSILCSNNSIVVKEFPGSKEDRVYRYCQV
ncbi:hypothetical protein C4D60_Mb11t07640 [Musa balbisiana]|uniref:Probable DNA helicase MCM8 n=1 Tax=Musa balbisiana TaxID=52838 RepID=A0A4S8J2G1_MUSBA|nr:hypothetical protein C4D60_Mb11t07640 [Musa balbisiana]